MVLTYLGQSLKKAYFYAVGRTKSFENEQASYRAFNNRTKQALAGRKTDDGTIGYMPLHDNLDDTLIIPVSKTALLEHVLMKDRDDLSPNGISLHSNRFYDNNQMIEMPEIGVDENGVIRVIDGNHRLEVLLSNREDRILMFVLDKNPVSLAKQAKIIWDKIGDRKNPFVGIKRTHENGAPYNLVMTDTFSRQYDFDGWSREKVYPDHGTAVRARGPYFT